MQETVVRPSNLLQPLFIHADDSAVPIGTMPGMSRLSVKATVDEVAELKSRGVKNVILFPKIDDSLKSNYADECWNPDGLVPTCVKAIKDAHPDVMVYTDIALDPYSSKGHDGVVDEASGRILNDETVAVLCAQALCHAKAGSDMVAPSDMMDGRIGAIRGALDSRGDANAETVGIMAYTAKFASAYYGPFRDALDSHPGFGDKKTYQQDPSNIRESLLETALDNDEGADILMVKPGLPYLDILSRMRDSTELPLAVYHVSGEYAMMKAAAEKGMVNEKNAVMETMKCFKRAGADLIATYYAKDVAKWIQEGAKSGDLEGCF